MIKEMDDLLQHWADQQRRRGLRQCTPIGKMVEFGGVPPRSTRVQGSRDPLGLGEMDDAAWEVERALRCLEVNHRLMADEHYLMDASSSDERVRRLGLARQTYYDRLDALHRALKAEMAYRLRRTRRVNGA